MSICVMNECPKNTSPNLRLCRDHFQVPTAICKIRGCYMESRHGYSWCSKHWEDTIRICGSQNAYLYMSSEIIYDLWHRQALMSSEFMTDNWTRQMAQAFVEQHATAPLSPKTAGIEFTVALQAYIADQKVKAAYAAREACFANAEVVDEIDQTRRFLETANVSITALDGTEEERQKVEQEYRDMLFKFSRLLVRFLPR